MDFASRAARNEEFVRDVNRRIEQGAKLHGVGSAMPFHCECAQDVCLEKIELDAQTYEPILMSVTASWWYQITSYPALNE